MLHSKAIRNLFLFLEASIRCVFSEQMLGGI